MNRLQRNFNDIPVELRQYLTVYLDQSEIIRDLREQIRNLLARNETLRRNNQRLTLQAIQQLADIQNLEFILANGLEDDRRDLARQLNFENLSDSEYSEAETVFDVDV